MKSDDTDTVEVVDRNDRPASEGRGDQPTHDDPTDDELMACSGVDPIYSTTEAAEFFDRSNQWLYWGLRERVFTHEDGTPIELDRTGDPSKGRRQFTLPIIEEIMHSSYRRGNMSQAELKNVMRRIRFAQRGVEWRDREGWRYARQPRNRRKWVRPEKAFKKSGEWWVRPDAKP
jgi:hypothetical protein